MIKDILKGENLRRVFFAFLKENNAFYNYIKGLLQFLPQAKDLWVSLQLKYEDKKTIEDLKKEGWLFVFTDPYISIDLCL